MPELRLESIAFAGPMAAVTRRPISPGR